MRDDTTKVTTAKVTCFGSRPYFFFIISPLTQKLTHKPWPITTITPLSPGGV
jgi:hypothetical protein